MEPNKKMNFISRKKSFSYAFNGLYQLYRQEPNAKIHTIATLAAIIAGVVRHISVMQWAAIVFAIALVWITEALNTCIERLCNLWCDNKWHPEIKLIKDIAAGAVLISAFVSIAIGILVFLF
jgi:diacylglycerol kinase